MLTERGGKYLSCKGDSDWKRVFRNKKTDLENGSYYRMVKKELIFIGELLLRTESFIL
jgi:hypothetical protein